MKVIFSVVMIYAIFAICFGLAAALLFAIFGKFGFIAFIFCLVVMNHFIE